MFSQKAWLEITHFMGVVDKISTIDELNENLESVLKQLGVSHLICISAFGMPAMQNRKPMFGFRDTAWVKHYRKMNYHIDDALPQYALKLRHWEDPFWWTDFVAENDLTPLQLKIFSEAHSHGLKQGVVFGFPVDVDDNDDVVEFAYASVAGDIVKSDEIENTLLTVLLAAHRTARRIHMRLFVANGSKFLNDPIVNFSPNIKNIDSLTPTELATLKQFVENDTYEQIAAAMGCSISNVKKHLSSAQDKLEFGSRKEMLVSLLRHHHLI